MSPSPAPVAVPEVEGPIAGRPANRLPGDIAEQYGYVEEELFLSGEATAYEPVGALSDDGRWTVRPADTAPYKTRVLVRRPADLGDFDGTVIVEWFNVTAGVDGDPDFGLLHPVILGRGNVYVGVSAQQVGVGGGTPRLEIPGAPPAALRPLTESNPERYGSLHHPGDGFSFDIYAQVAAAARAGLLLGGATPRHVIAIGESQSAFRLVSFLNAVQPITDAFDGFLVHSRGAGGAPLWGSQHQPDPDADPVAIRTDLDVPVLQFETETDLTFLGYLAARQPDTDRIVTWEVAGTAHADASLLEYGARMRAELGAEGFDIASMLPSINNGPQREVLRAAFVALSDWVTDGTPPPTAAPIDTVDGALRRDPSGLVVGGIRTPAVEAPVAVLTGESDQEGIIFALFGSAVPFTDEQLRARYPTHDDYVAAVTASADEAVASRFLLPDDRDRIVADAQAAAIPPPEPG